MKKCVFLVIVMTCMLGISQAHACTGITLQTTDSATITARTIEWAAQPLTSMYVVVPRGYKQRSLVPDGSRKGARWMTNYGYVGIAVENDAFVMEGINEAGLSAGLFYFPSYGEYLPYDGNSKHIYINDMQFVSWVLGCFSSIDDMVAVLPMVRIIGIDSRASTVHWRVTDPSGRQVVIEIVDQEVRVYENPLGVLTNSPDLPWHLTNLNNYVNLVPGNAVHTPQIMSLHAFGGGSGMLGLPGDMTPPSRFIRAAFYQTTAPRLSNTEQTVQQAFHLLNQFDIPIGMQFSATDTIPDMPSATQISIVTDLQHQRLYFRTMYNATIRCIDLQQIDFDRVRFQTELLDVEREQPIELIEIY